MTTRLYYADSYLTEFSATVQLVDGDRVYLDRSAFYPTSGGQLHDVGTLNNARVTDVLDDGDRITHMLDGAHGLAAGTTVTGRIDWPRRFDHMQQHTGQHLLSAVFDDLFGYRTISVHFGADSATLDLDTESISDTKAARAERGANEAVLRNHAVTISVEDAATAAGLRKPSDRAGQIRVISIAGLDRSACGGTHVRSTAEIGPIVIRRVEKYKKLGRVEFLCGWRTLARARADFDALSAMAAAMTAGIAELPGLVSAQAAAARAAQSDLRKLTDEVAGWRVRSQLATLAADPDGTRRLVVRDGTLDELRAMGQMASHESRTVFIGVVQQPPAIVYAATADTGINAGAVLKAALGDVGGRGGGSPRAAQGSVPDLAALERVVTTLSI